MNIETESEKSSTETAAAHFWKYVTKLEKASVGGGNVAFRCNYCEKTFKGSYSRVKVHLLKLSNFGIQPCAKAGDEYQNEMQKLEDAYEESSRRLKKPKLVSLPTDSPTSYNKLRTTLLQKERAYIEKLLRSIKDTWKEQGLSIVSDGWIDVQKRPLINFMATSKKGPLFIKSIDGIKEYKDKHFIADFFLKIIDEVGHEHVVQIITDNASVMKAAGSIVEAEYPHIFWSPCVVHTLNLTLRNICAPKNSLQNELLVVAKTQFASIIIMLKRLFQVKQNLRNVVISEEWMSSREDDVGKAQTMRDYVLNDLWWDKVYEMWDSMIENVKKEIYRHEGKEDYEESSFYDVVHNILIEWWTKNCTPLHCLAHSLNLKYYTNQWIEEVRGRVVPHKDAEIAAERNKCLKRFFPNPDDGKKVNMEFGLFLGIKAYDDDNMEDSGPTIQCFGGQLMGPVYQRRPEYTTGESKKWDIGGDNWDELFGGPGLLEIAYLTLDELEMETSIVENDNYVDDDDVVVL
nr:uncharacterized protein LOC112030572 [Quercus suber]